MKTSRRGFPGQVGRVLQFSILGLALLASGDSLRAQAAEEDVAAVEEETWQKLTPEELSDLLGPIALYPDALIALILPASTVPTDITLAARYLAANGESVSVDDQQWDESVKSLTKYPVVLKWLDQNLQWTEQLGDAFIEQPADVMNTIQVLREKARKAGNLVDTPQQTVEVQDDAIQIVPTDPEVIYVPVYNTEVVYVETAPSYPVITYVAGCPTGAWLNFGFDWRQRCLYRGGGYAWNNRRRDWNGGERNSRTVVNNVTINNNTTTATTTGTRGAERWQPSEKSRRQFVLRQAKNVKNNPAAQAAARAARGEKPATVSQSQPANARPKNPKNPANQPGATTATSPNQRHASPGEKRQTAAGSQPRKQPIVRDNGATRVQSIAAPTTAAPQVNPAPAARQQGGQNAKRQDLQTLQPARDPGQPARAQQQQVQQQQQQVQRQRQQARQQQQQVQQRQERQQQAQQLRQERQQQQQAQPRPQVQQQAARPSSNQGQGQRNNGDGKKKKKDD
jgi:hypothetical protein